jgi:hypothetical protein
MAGVEDDRIVRRVEHPVQRHSQLDDAEVRAEVTTRRGHLVDQEVADFGGQIAQFRLREMLQIGGPTDLFKHPASVRRATNSGRRPAQIPPRRRTSLAQKQHRQAC